MKHPKNFGTTKNEKILDSEKYRYDEQEQQGKLKKNSDLRVKTVSCKLGEKCKICQT